MPTLHRSFVGLRARPSLVSTRMNCRKARQSTTCITMISLPRLRLLPSKQDRSWILLGLHLFCLLPWEEPCVYPIWSRNQIEFPKNIQAIPVGDFDCRTCRHLRSPDPQSSKLLFRHLPPVFHPINKQLQLQLKLSNQFVNGHSIAL